QSRGTSASLAMPTQKVAALGGATARPEDARLSPIRTASVARHEQLPSDHEPLDLRGALVDLEPLGVAHQLLDRVLLDVAVAAEDLDGVGRDLHGRVRGRSASRTTTGASPAGPGRAATPPATRAAAPPRSRPPAA